LRYCAQRLTVDARSGAISGTGLRRATPRFWSPFRTTPRGYWVARRDSGCQRARCAARSLCDAIRFRVRVRVAPRGYRAARRDCGRGLAPRRAVMAWRDAVLGVGLHYVARIPRGSTRLRAQVRAAPRDKRAARRNSGCGSAPRRAARLPRSVARFLHIFVYICVSTLYSSIFQHIPAHTSTFRIFATFAEHVGICRNPPNIEEC